jgi:hypothetical protein
MPVALTKIADGGAGTIEEGTVDVWQGLANADVVPMAAVFAEVANALVRIEKNVFVPVIIDPLNLAMTPLEPDNLVVRVAELSTRSERNERLDVVGNDLELLKNGEIGIFGV